MARWSIYLQEILVLERAKKDCKLQDRLTESPCNFPTAGHHTRIFTLACFVHLALINWLSLMSPILWQVRRHTHTYGNTCRHVLCPIEQLVAQETD